MKNKKLELPSKETIISGVQFFLILYTMTMGFIFTYLFAWFAIGLPQEVWSIIVCVVAGLLSVGGLFTWIVNGNRKAVGKKDMCESAKSICNNNCESCARNE